LKKIKKFLIAIDGPSASGKSTAAKKIAKKYNMFILQSGLLFRYAAKIIIEKKPKNKIILLNKIFKKINLKKIEKLNLHTPEISQFSAIIAKELKVRLIIKKFQKRYVNLKKKVVLEGRDQAKIFPNSEVKFFIVCNPLSIAAKRRWLQLKRKKKKVSLKQVLKDLKKRDYLDKNRKYSKLERHRESVYINTAKIDIKSVTDKMSKIIDKKLNDKYGS
jgi:cytidylate kinase